MATVVGDPAKIGEYYAYFLKAPAGGTAPPHFHKMTENVTVVSGDFMVGLGDSINQSEMKTLPPGTVASIPAGVHHYAIAKTETILVVSGIGPDITTLINK
jgi:quercetin dioxygenase-like cupin family protein